MKVALVIEWLDPWRGGAETSTQQFIHALMARSVDLHVYTRSRLSSTPNMRIHTITPPSLARASQTRLFSRRADRRIAGQRFDVVHAITPCMEADIYQPRGGTVVETVQRNLALKRSEASRSAKRLANYFNIKQQLMLRFEKKLFSQPDPPVVAAVSQYVADQMRRHYSYPEDRIRVVYNAVDLDDATPQQRAADRKEIRKLYDVDERDYLVLLMAHNFKLKGVGRWIDALGLLAGRKDLRLHSLIVGKENPLKWQRELEKRGIRHLAQFVGPTRRAWAFRHAADVLVHPTYYDPCSRVVLEALSSGLPCITTRFDGAAESIVDDKHGIVLDSPENVQGLAEAVVRLSDVALRRRMSEASGELRERISMRRHAEEMWQLYQDVAGKVGAR